jgi:hypothetical protein
VAANQALLEAIDSIAERIQSTVDNYHEIEKTNYCVCGN